MPKAESTTKRAPKKTARAKKDKNAPKKALSAYMFMSQDWRERIKAENPDASFGEVGKLLGQKWKEMNDEEKRPYEEMAERDKKRAEQDKIDYESKKSAVPAEADAAPEDDASE